MRRNLALADAIDQRSMGFFGNRDVQVERGIGAFAALASVALAVALSFPDAVVAAENSFIQLMQSTPASSSANLAEVASGDSASVPSLVRTGDVSMRTAVFESSSAGRQAGAFVAKTLGVEFFQDTYVEMQVTSESHPATGIVSLTGRAKGSDLATFSLTVAPDSYLMTYKDPNSPNVYRVVGDSATGAGRVAQHDLSKRPPVIHSPPLFPPAE